MSVHLAPIGNGFQFLDANARPLTAGLLYTYQAGTTTPAATYTTSAGDISNANPIVLNVDGRSPQEIWLTDGQAYKFVLKDVLGNQIASYDNLTGIGDTTALSTQIAALEANLASETPTTGASLVGFLLPRTGAVGETVQAKLQQVVSVMDFGAVGDGVTDDTAAIQAALNVFTNGRSAIASGSIYFPAGIYKITSPLIYGGGAGHTLVLYGDSGGARNVIVGTAITWGGTSGTSMVIFYGANECLFENINLDGGSGSGLSYCVHVTADNVVSTTLSGSVTAGAGVVATPASMANIATGMALGIDAGGPNFEVVYVTATTGATFTATFKKSHSSGVQVGGSAGSSGCTFQRTVIGVPTGAATAGILWGNATAGGTMQVSEGKMVGCNFVSAGGAGAAFAGTRVITGGNVKNFTWDRCNFNGFQRAISNESTSGAFSVHFPIFANTTVYDVYHAGTAPLVITAAEAESGTAHLFINAPSTTALITVSGCSWQSAAPAADDIIISAGGSLNLIGNDFKNSRTGTSVPKIQVGNLGSPGNNRSGIFSSGNYYQNATDATVGLFQDGSGNDMRFFTGGLGNTFQPQLFTINDHGGSGGPYTSLSPILGFASLTPAMLTQVSCSPGVVPVYTGRMNTGVTKVTVPYTAFQAAALTKDLSVVHFEARRKLIGVIADTTVAFGGTAGTITLQIESAPGTNDLILAHDVKSAPVVKGLADADLGPLINRANAVQGGYIPSWTVSFQWNARLTSGAGNLSGLNAGSVDLYFVMEAFP